MYKPGEVASKTFKIKRKGYDKTEVDGYLKAVGERMDFLIKENVGMHSTAAHINKDKDRQKEKMLLIWKALDYAKKESKNLIQASQARAEEIIYQADKEFAIADDNNRQLFEKQKEYIIALREEANTFVEGLKAIYKQHLESLNGASDLLNTSIPNYDDMKTKLLQFD